MRRRRRKCRTSPFISIKPVPRHLTSARRYIYLGAHVVRTYAFIYVYRIAVSHAAFVFIRAGRTTGKKWCGKWAEKWSRKWSSSRLPVRGINRASRHASRPRAPAHGIARIPLILRDREQRPFAERSSVTARPRPLRALRCFSNTGHSTWLCAI